MFGFSAFCIFLYYYLLEGFCSLSVILERETLNNEIHWNKAVIWDINISMLLYSPFSGFAFIGAVFPYNRGSSLALALADEHDLEHQSHQNIPAFFLIHPSVLIIRPGFTVPSVCVSVSLCPFNL